MSHKLFAVLSVGSSWEREKGESNVAAALHQTAIREDQANP